LNSFSLSETAFSHQSAFSQVKKKKQTNKVNLQNINLLILSLQYLLPSKVTLGK